MAIDIAGKPPVTMKYTSVSFNPATKNASTKEEISKPPQPGIILRNGFNKGLVALVTN
jgi:hypothetical protein